MKVKTSELSGPALDWAVAKCEGYESGCGGVAPYSTDWPQGGQIIERHIAKLEDLGDEGWEASGFGFTALGDTPLIAAMRCYVASQLGNEVDVPEELCRC